MGERIKFTTTKAQLKPRAIIKNKIIGRYEAEISYRKSLELKPDHADAHNNLSNALRKKSLLINIFETRKSMKKIQ